MTLDPGSLANLTDEEVHTMLRRALRLVLVLAAILCVVFTLARGWQSGLLLLAGAAISYTGIIEWRSLTRLIFTRMDNQQKPHMLGRTLVMFFLRLGAVALVLYVSLRCLHGTVYALVAGIGLGVVALSFEAIRLLRG
jgi:phosphate starvation-inducible membrane PsiE